MICHSTSEGKARKQATAVVSGRADNAATRQLRVCGSRPLLKRGDWCLWSSPPDALQRTVHALNTDFRLFARDSECASFLHYAFEHVPSFSENILLCAAFALDLTREHVVLVNGSALHSFRGSVARAVQRRASDNNLNLSQV